MPVGSEIIVCQFAGMLHSPFAVPPQFWGQLQAGMPTNEPDMQSVFQLAQQVSLVPSDTQQASDEVYYIRFVLIKHLK